MQFLAAFKLIRNINQPGLKHFFLSRDLLNQIPNFQSIKDSLLNNWSGTFVPVRKKTAMKRCIQFLFHAWKHQEYAKWWKGAGYSGFS
jgi:hypothetical protein